MPSRGLRLLSALTGRIIERHFVQAKLCALGGFEKRKTEFMRHAVQAPLAIGLKLNAKLKQGHVSDKIPISHTTYYGKNVPLVKRQNCVGKIMALTLGEYSAHNVPMKAAADFNSEFAGRVRELREGTGLTQEQMADALGIPFERYRKYEQKIMMPHRLLHQFALIVRSDLDYLLTGRTKARARRHG